MDISRTVYQGEEAFNLSSEDLTAVVIPSSGGKIASLKHRSSGYELMYQNPRWGVSPRGYDGTYDQSATGMDELFPMIAGESYPEAPWKGIQSPDKGEIWNQPMESEIRDGLLSQCVRGVRFPYLFSRTVKIEGETVFFDYHLKNQVPYEFKALWSVQPHMNLSAGSALSLKGSSRFVIDFSFDEKINDSLIDREWPAALGTDGESRDFSGPMKIDGGGEKIYLMDHSDKEIDYINREAGLTARFNYDCPAIPCCGIWIDRGAWPGDNPDSLIAVGPSIGVSDSFDRSLSRGTVLSIPPKGELKWNWSIKVFKS